MIHNYATYWLNQSLSGTGALVQWLNLPAWKVGDRGFTPHPGLQVKDKMFLARSLAMIHSPGV